MNEVRHKRIIISGGGTGGHIFPAIAIANALRRTDPDIVILFVGADGRMEMEKVPAAGYEIKGLPVEGIVRSFSPKNFMVLFKLGISLLRARKIIREFSPDVVVGVGGYASGPVLKIAGRMNIPTIIQEQNSYAGVTNKLLAGKAEKICVAYEGMERYFPVGKIIHTGNPVRKDVVDLEGKREEAYNYFGLMQGKPVVLVLGGSLGSATINESIASGLELIERCELQVIWQTGKLYYERMKEIFDMSGILYGTAVAFINRMDLAFAAADIIVSRAGAGTISELCLAAKPVILVPSPNVAEDHQTKNAEALSEKGAAILISDSDARENLVQKIVELSADDNKRHLLSASIAKLAIPDSDNRIAEEILKLVK